jgi:hypothetical protein
MMAKPLPGKNQPTPIRPKSVISVSSRGKVNVGSVIKHPSDVERIAFTHREAQYKLNAIARKVDPHLHKKR